MALRLPIEEYHALCKIVLDRDGWKCRHCKIRNNLSCHHIQYRSHGGDDTTENLCTLCIQCHEAIHSGKLEIVQEVELLGADGALWFESDSGWRPE